MRHDQLRARKSDGFRHVESPEGAWIGYIPCKDRMGAPSVDTSQWPLCRISMLGVKMTPEQFEEHLGSVEALFARGQTFVLLIDSRGGTAPSARQRQDIARRMKRWSREHPGGMAGLAVVLTSAVDRGVFTAVSWAATKTFPMRAFSTPQEAEAWLREQL